MNKLDSINSPFISYPDYKKFQNILTDTSVSVKDFINPLNFFIPSDLKISKLNKKEFMLDEVYKFENELNKLHPENRHIKDKIRQQLQFLRDKGYLSFAGGGKYKLS